MRLQDDESDEEFIKTLEHSEVLRYPGFEGVFDVKSAKKHMHPTGDAEAKMFELMYGTGVEKLQNRWHPDKAASIINHHLY